MSQSLYDLKEVAHDELEVGTYYLMRPSDTGPAIINDYIVVKYSGPVDSGHLFKDDAGIFHLATNAQFKARILLIENI